MSKIWFFGLKKVLASEPKQKKEQEPHKAKNWFGKSKKLDLTNSSEAKLKEIEEKQSRHAYSVAIATAAAAKAAIAAAEAAAEVVRLTALSSSPGNTKEEIAAIKIQTAFRGYIAKRALCALRGLVRLKSLIRGKHLRRQAKSTLQSMQTLARLQYQIRERRLLQLSEDKQACARQLQQKHNKDFDKIGENWDDRSLLREKVEANMLNKQVATRRREKAIEYAYNHHNLWKNSSKFGSQTFIDPNNNPHLGWSWLERWMAARQNELTLAPDNADKDSSLNNVVTNAISEMVTRDKNHSPRGKTSNNSRRGSSPRVRQVPSGDEDSKSMLSNRKHSISGSTASTRDDDSLKSSHTQSVPGYMAPTKAAKARTRFSNVSPLSSEKTAKKRLSLPGSPKTVRRLSGPRNGNK